MQQPCTYQSQPRETLSFRVEELDKYLSLEDNTVNSIIASVSDLRNNGAEDSEIIAQTLSEFDGISSPFAGVESDENMRLTNIFDICEDTWFVLLEDIIAKSIFSIPCVTTEDERDKFIYTTRIDKNNLILEIANDN